MFHMVDDSKVQDVHVFQAFRSYDAKFLEIQLNCINIFFCN